MVQRRAAELVQRDKGEDVVDNDVVHDKERELLLVLPKKMVSMSNSIGAVMLQRVVLQHQAVERFLIQEAVFQRRSKWGGRWTRSEGNGGARSSAHESEQREHSARAAH